MTARELNAFQREHLTQVRATLVDRRQAQLNQMSALLELSAHAQQMQAEHLGLRDESRDRGVDVFFGDDLVPNEGLDRGTHPHSKAAERAEHAVTKKRTRTAAMAAAASAAAMGSDLDCPKDMKVQLAEEDQLRFMVFAKTGTTDTAAASPQKEELSVDLLQYFDIPPSGEYALQGDTLLTGQWDVGFLYKEDSLTNMALEASKVDMRAYPETDYALTLCTAPRDAGEACRSKPYVAHGLESPTPIRNLSYLKDIGPASSASSDGLYSYCTACEFEPGTRADDRCRCAMQHQRFEVQTEPRQQPAASPCHQEVVQTSAYMLC